MLVSTHRQPGIIVKAHRFEVPLDYEQPNGRTIHIFARELVSSRAPNNEYPYLVYLQGGPGFECRPPVSNSGWVKHALKKYNVLLLDQRGTGHSTPVCQRTLAAMPSAEEQAAYLSFFRADAIVQDAETVRKKLLGHEVKWHILGQSFGGFCAVHYLSAAPEGLLSAMITGGLPPLQGSADAVYEATCKRVIKRNQRYFQRYPDDAELVQQIVAELEQKAPTLPGGTKFTPRVFQQLGMSFGMSTAFEETHYLLQSAFVDGPQGPELSYRFVRGVQNRLPFETNPIYALLHEAIYCQQAASRWSAQRVTNRYPDFRLTKNSFCFTGEMIYPWMFADYYHLQPLAEVAEILANKEDWPRLYDLHALANNEVPCAAVVYDDDMYVEREFSMQTAASIQKMRVWVTSEFDHNGLRQDGPKILDYLMDLIQGNR